MQAPPVVDPEPPGKRAGAEQGGGGGGGGGRTVVAEGERWGKREREKERKER